MTDDEVHGRQVGDIDSMIEQAKKLPDANLLVPIYEGVKRGEITPLGGAREIAAERQRRSQGPDPDKYPMLRPMPDDHADALKMGQSTIVLVPRQKPQE